MRMRTSVFSLIVLALAALPAFGNTLTVTNTNDSGSGSLRAAVAAASPGDTINFNLTYPATITFASQIVIPANLTISGPGASNLTLSGNNATGIFSISSGVTASISGVTIENGQSFSGGAIYNSDGTLTIASSTLSANSGALGGAIYNFLGTVTITGSTLSANSATYYGGAIYNTGGTVTVINSTLWGNSSPGEGGALYNYNRSNLTLVNSTLAANSAQSGGGIYNYEATLILKSTLVATSTGGNCASFQDVAATSDGYNLSDDTSCSYFLTSTTDENSIAAGLDPSGLQDNGGPTKTDALLPTSPAVDKIPPAACTLADDVTLNTTDQRGITRPQGPACDIGAFELVETAPFSSFTARVKVGLHFDLDSTFTLGSGSSGINPLSQAVSLQLGTYYNVTIPAGSFHQLTLRDKKGPYVFSGVISGSSISVEIEPLANNSYQFKAIGSPLDLTGFTNPVSITLTIGTNTGTTSAYADFCDGYWWDWGHNRLERDHDRDRNGHHDPDCDHDRDGDHDR